MNKTTKLIICLSMLALLSACAKREPAPVQVPGAVANVSQPVDQRANKFAFGPHKGLLGVRQYYFNCNSSLLPTYYYKALRAHAAYLKQHPSMAVQAQGFTFAAGSREYNVTVGERRADAVVSYLQLQNVAKNQLSALSYGAELDKAYTGKVNTKNCRVDLVYSNVN